MSNELLTFIILGGVVALTWLWEFFALAIDYRWYWQDYRRRLEPWTFEWRRYVKGWWWMVLIKAAPFVVWVLCTILFPPFTIPLWAKITIAAFGFVVFAFYSWLLLHLGGYALQFINWVRRSR